MSAADFALAVIAGLPLVVALARWIATGHRTYTAITRPRIPAAPDNQPGRDTELLWTCRRIAAQPTARKEKHQP